MSKHKTRSVTNRGDPLHSVDSDDNKSEISIKPPKNTLLYITDEKPRTSKSKQQASSSSSEGSSSESDNEDTSKSVSKKFFKIKFKVSF